MRLKGAADTREAEAESDLPHGRKGDGTDARTAESG